ncbi:DNA gyrase subunit A [Patescibacteria group bacterium]|nr:DNA gyrase subunit A [Patescibacteria group bacterium]
MSQRGKVEALPIVEEMQSSYLDYAMSVIVARALPDVRDGLKPVHRRILFAMWQMGLRSGAKFRKSAAVVGEVLGKYHPHGDMAVYDSMVRMAQDFSLRYPMVNGQGNFGSVDGDRQAAMRYTEAKLMRLAEESLYDIEKDTVDFSPNYDGTRKEPLVLPSKLPQLLLNGTMGIAVGMATAIPPHNFGELVDGINLLIDNPEANIDELMKFIKGPDFPTGGEIFDTKEIKQAYATGKGRIVARGKAEIVESKNNQFQIIISEIPYQVNKATLISKIADLVQEKKLVGIRDIRDESAKGEIRIVIELKRDAYPNKILNRLYSLTQLQDNFHMNMLALVDGLQPRVMTLKTVLEEFIKHRQVVVKRRTEFDLRRAEERAHILTGLKKALDHLDPVIKIIKKSQDRDDAKKNLMKKFKFTEIQAIAILEMKLQQLANLERKKIDEELKEKLQLIKDLKLILSSPKKIKTIIKDELKALREKFGDDRRTKVNLNAIGQFTQEDLIPKEPTIILVTKDGYIKRTSPEDFHTQKRGGKGVIGLTTKETDTVEHFFTTNTHADLLFFTTAGRVFQLKAYDVPAASRTAKGQAIVNFLQLGPEEKISAVHDLADLIQGKCKFLVMVTKKGVIKKVDIDDFANVRKSGLIAIKLKKEDQLQWVKASCGKEEIILCTKNGQAIRFKESQIRSMGRNASGVRGIRLKKEDKVVGMDIIGKDANIAQLQFMVVMANGFGKRTGLKNYRLQSRAGTGIKTAKVTNKTGQIIWGRIVDPKVEDRDLIIISQNGQVIRLPQKSVSVSGRATQGVRLMRFSNKEDKVATVTLI